MNDRARWRSLCTRLHAEQRAEEAFDALARAYGDPARAYHNLDHTRHCLREFDTVAADAAMPDAVEFAIWFHDFVYDPRSADNEEKSAEAAVQCLREAGAGDAFTSQVQSLILLTRHNATHATIDGEIIVDADLSILGQTPNAFNDYEARIRKEYAWLDDEAFDAGRADFLRSLLKRERIFLTEAFFGRYECAARNNIERSLASIDRAEE